jgi:TonB family protein
MTDATAEFERWMESSHLASACGDRLGAEVALTAAISASEGVEGLEHARADALLRLAAFQQEAGNLVDAEQLVREALATRERSPARDDAALISTLAALGRVLVLREDAGEARTILTRALTLSDKTAHAHDEGLVALLYDLGGLCMRQSAYSLAEPLLQRLLAIKRANGEDHADVATVLASLGKVRLSLGDPESAERYYRRALQIRERTLAPNHFAIAATLEHLADACAARGKVAEAVSLLQRALSMRELTLGAAHPSVRAARERIADLQLQASEVLLGDVEPQDHASAVSPQAVPRATPEPLPLPLPLAFPQPPLPVSDVSPRATDHVAPAEVAERPTRTPTVLIPWAHELKAFQQDVGDADPRDDQHAADPSRGWMATVAPNRSGKVMSAAGGLVLLSLVALAVQARRARSAAEQMYVEVPPRIEAIRTGATRARSGEVELPLVTKARAPDSTRSSAAIAAAVTPTPSPTPAVVPLDAEITPLPTVAARTSSGAGSRAVTKKSSKADPPVPVPELPGPIIPNLAFKGIEAPRAVELPTRKITDSFPGRIASGAAEVGTKLNGNAEPSPTETLPLLIGAAPVPKYPDQLRGRRVEGQVLIQFVVDASGRPDLASLKVVQSPHEAMTEAVRRVMPQFRFEPARTAPPESRARAETVRYAFNFRAP